MAFYQARLAIAASSTPCTHAHTHTQAYVKLEIVRSHIVYIVNLNYFSAVAFNTACWRHEGDTL